MFGAGGLREETFEVVEGHVGIGAARQKPAERGAEVAQVVGRQGRDDGGQVASAALGVAQATVLQ